MERSLSYRPISHITQGNGIPFKVLIGKGQSGTQWNLAANYTMATIKTMLFGKNMHGSTHSFGGSRNLAIQFRHNLSGVNSHTNWLNVVPIRCYHSVLGKVHCMQRPRKYSFLPIVKM